MHAESKSSNHPINVQRRLKILLPFVCIHAQHSNINRLGVHTHTRAHTQRIWVHEHRYSQRSCRCRWCRTRRAGSTPPASA